MPVRLLPFVNVTPIKQITAGMAVLWALLCWRWRTRHTGRRVLLAYNLTVPPGLFSLLAARLLGAVALAWLADINEPGETVPSTPLFRFDFWLQRRLIPLFDGLVVVADSIAADFGHGRPYVRIDGGIREGVLDLTALHGVPRKPPESPFVVVFAGSLDQANGVLVLLQAFSLLHSRNLRLSIAGAGPLEQTVKEAASTDPRIQYLGFIPFKDVQRLYCSADVLVNMRLTKTLSTKYFFPSKLIEYLASGVPVISTCPAHVRDEFGDIAYLLDDESPEALAACIRRVAAMAPRTRIEKGARARSFIADSRTWDAQARRMARFIREMVSGVRGSSGDTTMPSASSKP